MKRCFVLWLVSLGALAAAMLMTAGAASAAAPYSCSGSFDNPGVLSGTYSTNVFVSGACVTGGPTTVTGNVSLQSGSVLIADKVGDLVSAGPAGERFQLYAGA